MPSRSPSFRRVPQTGPQGIGQLARADLWMVDAGGSGPARAGLRGTLATTSSPEDPALTKLASPGRDIIQFGYNQNLERVRSCQCES